MLETQGAAALRTMIGGFLSRLLELLLASPSPSPSSSSSSSSAAAAAASAS